MSLVRLVAMAGLRIVMRAVRRVWALAAPVLAPSWRFFDAVGPALRLQYAHCDSTGAVRGPWLDVAPPVTRRSPWALLVGLVFSPERNDVLYTFSCCERLLAEGARSAYDAIAMRVRIRAGVNPDTRTAAHVCFRILEIAPDDERLIATEVFVSDVVDRDRTGGTS